MGNAWTAEEMREYVDRKTETYLLIHVNGSHMTPYGMADKFESFDGA